MPTTARLIAAFCLMVVAWVVTEQVMAAMPPETQFGYFRLVNLVIAALCGWVVIGSRVGTDYVTSLSIGLTGVVAMVFWGLFVQAFNEMLRLALARRYDGPVEAVVDVFQLGIDFGANLVHLNILVTLFAGGVLTGVVVEFVNRRWT
ncbi:TrgA family protein [Aquicoccus porphyridii]|uniref:TrgA family protein n=1 Tax=Aquicoccus porphyridii TaxID=1852029 RepID=A0A5A9ZHY8_9RHOB|nr:TrgA family protein [Aquicoccus porphyridii]KAA0916589.1 TrgA family protein [Aquicoccus porphyridii]RAI53724.1 tellurium resistance protein [Rhodobacteraceae bacterium AsT-22]